MVAHLEDVEALYAAVKCLRDARKKMSRLSDKAGTAGIGPAYRKLVVDLDWQAFEVNRLEHKAHAAAVNCGLADLRSAPHYSQYSVKLSGFHEYLVTPDRPRDLGASPAGFLSGDMIQLSGNGTSKAAS